MVNLAQLSRVRWAVRATLLLGVAASVVANVLHAVDNPISQSIAAWPPLALLLTVELISRIPVHSRGLAAARILATAVIAGIAAWVSYWHMAGVAARYGETGASPYLLPVSVDGLIVVASICLVELAGRIRAAAEHDASRVDRADLSHAAAAGGHDTSAPASSDASVRATRDASRPARGDASRDAGATTHAPVADPAAEPTLTRFDHDRPIGPMPAPAARARRRPPRSLTAAERVAAAHGRAPAATHEQIAARAKVSVSTVKRYRPSGSPSGPDAAETIKAASSRELAGVES